MTWEKFKKMTFHQKLDHIWEYYRWHILITVVVLGLASSWVYGIVTEKEPLMEVLMINAYGRTPEGEAFRPFLEQAGYSYYDGAVTVNKKVQLNGPDGSQSYAGAQLLMCTLAAGEPDLIFWDSREVPPPLADGVLRDLRDILPPDLMAQYQEELVYAENADTGEAYPCGIYLEENPWVTEQMYYVNCTAGVLFSVKEEALAGAVLEEILTCQ